MEINNKNYYNAATKKLIASDIYTKKLWVNRVIVDRIKHKVHINRVNHLKSIGVLK